MMIAELSEPSLRESSTISSCHDGETTHNATFVSTSTLTISRSPRRSRAASYSSPLSSSTATSTMTTATATTTMAVSKMNKQRKNLFRVYSIQVRTTISVGAFLIVIIIFSIPSIISTLHTMSFLSSSSSSSILISSSVPSTGSRNTMETTSSTSKSTIADDDSSLAGHDSSSSPSLNKFQLLSIRSYDVQPAVDAVEKSVEEALAASETDGSIDEYSTATRNTNVTISTSHTTKVKKVQKLTKKWYSTTSFDFLPKYVQPKVKKVRRRTKNKKKNIEKTKRRQRKNRPTEDITVSVGTANATKSILPSQYDKFVSSLVRAERKNINTVDRQFVIRHPTTNELVSFYTYTNVGGTETDSASDNDNDNSAAITYSIDYIGALQNRSLRFPSIDFRVRLYMSNWYIPACTKEDTAAIWYTPERQIQTKEETDNYDDHHQHHHQHSQSAVIGNIQNVVTIQNHEDDDKNQNIWDIKSVVDADVLFYVDRTNIFELINDTQNIYGGYELAKINLLRSYSNDVASSIIPTMDRIGWFNSKNNDIDDTLHQEGTSTRTAIEAKSRSLRQISPQLSKARNDDDDDEDLDASNDEDEQVDEKELHHKVDQSPPIVVQYGDWNHCRDHADRWNVNIPSIKKFRRAIANPFEYITELIIKDTVSNDGLVSDNISNINTVDRCTTRKRLLPSIVSLVGDTNTMRSSLPMSMMQYQSIVWKLNTNRHYGMLPSLALLDTIPYLEKKNVAIFRGTMNSGQYQWIVNSTTITDEMNCQHIQRCNIVLMYNNSTIIDAKITKPHKVYHPEYIDIPTTTTAITTTSNVTKSNQKEGHTTTTTTSDYNHSTRIYLRGEKMTLQDILQHKMIIMLEGNDVSSGLKWALLSSSVVIMPYPVFVTSWVMEELLEPYIHFVPIQHDLSDLEYAVQWVLDNPIQAQYIALRGSLWIYDLFFHTNSISDEQYVQDIILERYRSNFFLK